MQTVVRQQNTLPLSSDDLTPAIMAEARFKPQLAFFKAISIKSFLFTFGISFSIAMLTFGAWRCDVFSALQAVLFGTRWTATASDQSLTSLPIWTAAIILVLVSLMTAGLIQHEGKNKIGFYLAGFFLFWFATGAALAHLWRIDILSVPGIFAGGATLLAVEIYLRMQIEKRLTENIRRLAIGAHSLEGKRAEARLVNGLHLLKTVLPLEEVVVFQLGKRGEWESVGRVQEKTVDTSPFKIKQAEWLEGIELCSESLKTQSPVVQKISGLSGAVRIAVPLVHEDQTLGALLVKFHKNFEPADKEVLTAFASQLARNFQRKATRVQEEAEKSSFNLFSRRTGKHRLEMFRLVSGILVEQQFGSLAFAEMADGYAIAYLDGTLAYVNKAMLKAAQVTGDRIKQLDLFGLLERFKDGVFDEPRIAIRRVMQTGESYRHEIFLAERGQILDLQISLVRQSVADNAVEQSGEFGGAVAAAANLPCCFMINVRDVTAYKENEKMRSDMVSLMSHELRTPITSINGFAELLSLEEKISEESREFVNIISTEAQRLARMLNTFLAVFNLEQADKREVVKIPIRLDAIAHEVLLNLQVEAKKKRIRLFELANTNLPPVAGDKDMVIKAITQLIDNAIKYSPERTTVTVSTALEMDAVRLTVEDRGYGIPTDSLEKVWSKFYRVPREGQDKDETSTGLGLSFVKEVVEQHGGSVFVESEVNRGSKFSFTLPRL